MLRFLLLSALVMPSAAVAADVNLTIDNIDVVPAWWNIVKVTVEVTNTDSGDAIGPICVDVFKDAFFWPRVDDQSPIYSCISVINSLETKEFTFYTPAPLVHDLWVAIVDTDDFIIESDEDDNLYWELL